MRTYLPLLWLLAGVAATAEAEADPQPIVTTDLLRLRTVTSIDVAPDGSGVVFVVRAIAADDDASEQPASAHNALLSSIQGMPWSFGESARRIWTARRDRRTQSR